MIMLKRLVAASVFIAMNCAADEQTALPGEETALPNEQKVSPNTPINWTGYYAGLDAGVIFNQSQLSGHQSNFLSNTNAYNQNISVTSFLPGFHGGYNYQLPSNLVIGAELAFTYPDSLGRYNYSTANGSLYDKFSFKNRLQGSILTKIGYSVCNFLPYFTVGASFADTGSTYTNESGNSYSNQNVQVGWVMGAGLEYSILQNLSVRTEYLYTDYGRPSTTGIPNVSGTCDASGVSKIDLVTHSIKVGLSYHF